MYQLDERGCKKNTLCAFLLIVLSFNFITSLVEKKSLKDLIAKVKPSKTTDTEEVEEKEVETTEEVVEKKTVAKKAPAKKPTAKKTTAKKTTTKEEK